MLELILGERKISKHLACITESLHDPFDAPVTCARGIEGLARLVFDSADKKKRWAAFRENLNLTFEYITLSRNFPRVLATGP